MRATFSESEMSSRWLTSKTPAIPRGKYLSPRNNMANAERLVPVLDDPTGTHPKLSRDRHPKSMEFPVQMAIPPWKTASYWNHCPITAAPRRSQPSELGSRRGRSIKTRGSVRHLSVVYPLCQYLYQHLSVVNIPYFAILFRHIIYLIDQPNTSSQ